MSQSELEKVFGVNDDNREGILSQLEYIGNMLERIAKALERSNGKD